MAMREVTASGNSRGAGVDMMWGGESMTESVCEGRVQWAHVGRQTVHLRLVLHLHQAHLLQLRCGVVAGNTLQAARATLTMTVQQRLTIRAR